MTDEQRANNEAFLAAVGRFTIIWAKLEFGIDLCMVAIYRHYDGKSIERQMPGALKKKIKFLRRAFRTIPALKDNASRFATFADQVHHASDMRHDMIHGITITSAVVAPPGDVVMVRLLRESADFRPKPFKVTTNDVLREALQAGRLTEEAFAFAQMLSDSPSRT